MKLSVLTLALLLSASALASTSNGDRITCPNVTEDARALLTTVQTLKDQLRQLPECQSVADRLNIINRVLANDKWKDVKNTILLNGTTTLEGADVTAVTQLTTEVSTALTETVSMLGGNFANCVPPQRKASFLGTLSGVTREVSGILGNVTGPYGQSISLVGNLLSGAIAGVDQLFKRNDLYDFTKPAEEMLFMNQFCAFTQSQQNVRAYLELEETPAQLRGMMSYLLQNKVKDLVENCPECAAYKIAWDAKEAADRIVRRISEDANILDIPVAGQAPATFTRCSEIHRAFYSADSDFSQLMNLIERYENPMMSQNDRELIAEMTSATKSSIQTIYPRYSQCIAMDNQAISQRFNNFMRDDILRLPTTIFAQQLANFQRLANRKYRGGQNGDFMATSLDRVKWAREEIIRIERKITEPNYQMSKQVVLSQQDDLRQRLLNYLMPPYLRYRFRSNRNDTHQFMRHFQTFKTRQLARFNTGRATPITTMAELSTELKKDPVRARYFVSAYDQVFNESRIVVLQVINNKRFCDYLLYSRSMTNLNEAVCRLRSAQMDELQSQFATFNPDVAIIAEFDRWAEENLSIQSTFVRDYADRIRDWNAQGDTRWELIQTDN